MGNYGPVKPWVQTAGDTLGPMFGITDIGGYRAVATDMQGHPAGLALDFMCTKSQGDRLSAYAQQNAAALNIRYIIWWQHIWSVDRSSEGWRQMANRGSPTQNHYDHVHVSFNASGSNVTGLPVATPVNLPGLDAAKTAITSATRIVAWWTNPQNLYRVAAFAIGAVLFLIGLSRVSGTGKALSQGVNDTISTVVKEAL